MTEDPRIRDIRAVLDEVDQSGACEGDGAYLGSQLDRIRAIVDREPVAPRVFFPGDTVPADAYVMTEDSHVIEPQGWGWPVDVGHPVVALEIQTHAQWQAAVDRATSERAIPEPTEGQNRG